MRKKVHSKRLILRPLRKSDYTKWFDTYVNCPPSKNKWDLRPCSAQQCKKSKFIKRIKSHRKLANDDHYYWYGVFHKKSAELIGQIDFTVFFRESLQFCNFGYQIYNRHWSKGYGQEAARAGLKIGFRQLKLHRLEAAINLDNKKSIRLAKAIGMHREGIKKRYWFENGKWVDHLIYVATPEDILSKPANRTS